MPHRLTGFPTFCYRSCWPRGCSSVPFWPRGLFMPSSFERRCSALSAIAVPFKGTAKTLVGVGVSPCSAVLAHLFVPECVLWYTCLRPRAIFGLILSVVVVARGFLIPSLRHVGHESHSSTVSAVIVIRSTLKCTAKTLAAVGLTIYST